MSRVRPYSEPFLSSDMLRDHPHLRTGACRCGRAHTVASVADELPSTRSVLHTLPWAVCVGQDLAPGTLFAQSPSVVRGAEAGKQQGAG